MDSTQMRRYMLVSWDSADGQIKTGTVIDFIPTLDGGSMIIAETRDKEEEDRPLIIKPIRRVTPIG